MRQVLLPPATLQYEIINSDNQPIWVGLNPAEAMEVLKSNRDTKIVVTAWPSDHLAPPSDTIDLTPIIRQAIAQSRNR
jgi:hypothetical protein